MLTSVDGASLPTVYVADADTTARIHGDTLTFTPTRRTYAEVARVGLAPTGGAEVVRRYARDSLAAFEQQGDSINFISVVGGVARGRVYGRDSLVLVTFRGQRWSFLAVR